MKKDLRKLHPKQLEAIATKMTGLEPEVKLNTIVRADKNIHRRSVKGQEIKKGK